MKTIYNLASRFVLLYLLIPTLGSALTLTGFVYDDTGNPLPGAVVEDISNTTNRTTSGADGSYILNNLTNDDGVRFFSSAGTYTELIFNYTLQTNNNELNFDAYLRSGSGNVSTVNVTSAEIKDDTEIIMVLDDSVIIAPGTDEFVRSKFYNFNDKNKDGKNASIKNGDYKSEYDKTSKTHKVKIVNKNTEIKFNKCFYRDLEVGINFGGSYGPITMDVGASNKMLITKDNKIGLTGNIVGWTKFAIRVKGP